MEIRAVDFFLGFVTGIIAGGGLIWLALRVRRWFGYSEAGRLKSENRQLKRRLAEKDRHIGQMLSETERLAEKLRAGKKAEGAG
jgi:hypothetical protein